MQRTRSVSLSRSWSLSILHCSCWICVFNNGRCPDWSLSWVGKWSSNKQILKFLFMNFRQERNYTVGRKKQKQKKTATHRMILQAVAWLWNPEPLRNTPRPLEWMEPRKTEEAGEPWESPLERFLWLLTPSFWRNHLSSWNKMNKQASLMVSLNSEDTRRYGI